MKSGKVDAEEAAKELQDDATDLADDTLDAAKDSDIPDDAKKQLEDAQSSSRMPKRRQAGPQLRTARPAPPTGSFGS